MPSLELNSEWQPIDGNKLIGCIFKNKQDKEYVVEEAYYNKSKKSYKFRIRFSDSGYERVVYRADVVSGLIRDRLSGCVSDVASLGYASVYDNEKAYYIWNNIIKRCYDKKSGIGYERYGAKGVRVCDKWLRFDLFLEDLEKIEGYDEKMFNDGLLELDKDIKQWEKDISQRIYSLETCKFVSRKENDMYRDNTNNPFSKKSIKIKAIKDGVEHLYDSITAFCKEFMLNKSSVARAIKLNNQHKGWKFERIGE